MAKYESVNLLYKLLKQARYPLSKRQIQEKLECSAATVERYITELRDTYSQTVEYDREANGYRLQIDQQSDIELPSHLFTTQEINALLLIEQIIDELEPGFLKEDTHAVKQHLAKIRQQFTGIEINNEKRIRMINIGKRQGNIKHLITATKAVLKRLRIQMTYQARSADNDSKTTRDLSPQRLTHYRDNWYLDAWCHDREALRTFALDRISNIQLQESADKKIKSLSNKQLNEYYAQTFGIFGGEVQDVAKLKFTPHRSQWVSAEIWHQNQKGKWLDDGSYLLEIPYGNDTELIGDILKYGDQVEVIGPEKLRDKIRSQIQNLSKIYS